MWRNSFFTLAFLLSLGRVTGQPLTSPLASGKWYKVSVEYDAVYKIDYSFLKKIGINPDQINPGNIQIFAGYNGMLPQANSAPINSYLRETAIYIQGGDDGTFNSNDYILFFGQGPDVYSLNPAKGIFYYENNLYSDKNFYYLTVGSSAGKRLSSAADIAGSYPVVTEFDDVAYHETEQYNELHSGRDWWGELFDSKTEYTIRFEVPGIIDNTSITLIPHAMGQSFSESSFQYFLNDVPAGEHKVTPIFNSQYSIKGTMVGDTLTLNSTTTGSATKTNQDVKIRFAKASSGRSVGYLDFIVLQMKRQLALYGDQTIFTSLKSLQQPVSKFQIASSTASSLVWDVTDPFNCRLLRTSFDSNLSFNDPSDALKKYIVLSNKNYPVPTTVGEVTNQNLRQQGAVDLLVVTAPEFLSEAQRLASYRQSKNLLKTRVVTTTQVYNEFSGGKQDVAAIREMARYLYNQGGGIKNLLLFGRGSYDYKTYLTYNKNFVPTYESRNSLSPLETYSSDDFFGFMEMGEGNWGEDPTEANTLDIAVGRLPVKKLEEATIIVDKLIAYDNKNWGNWRKQILFVADDGDFNIHQGQSDQLAESMEASHPEMDTRKIYLDSYKQVSSAIGQVSPLATTALVTAVCDGVTLVNYTGHGSELQWMQERIFDQVSLDRWKTAPHFPLLVTATCEFGRNDDPGLISTAELSMFKKDGGSIGLVTTARPVNSSTNFTLNKAFYAALFTKDQNQFRNIGAVFRDTKNNSMSGVSNRNFSLLGDPSMVLALPSSEIRTEQVSNVTSNSDTLKGLSRVRVRGSVYSNGVPDASYSGSLTGTLYGAPTLQQTLGDENEPFSFNDRSNRLFNGQATVKQGQFEMDFVVPKSIDPAVVFGKLGLYAYSSAGQDATGAKSNVKIGSQEKNPGTDSSNPMISLYMGDTTFVNGGIASKNSRIVAILSDEHGIDISNFNPQTDIVATLDDTLSITLNQYFESDKDDFTRGKVNAPISNIKSGNHSLKLRASDTFGNTSTASISFYVPDENGIEIEEWLAYPNPASSGTTFRFRHNRSGEDLEADVTVFNAQGQPMLTTSYQIDNSAYQVDLPKWDTTTSGGTKLGAGLYLLKLSIRSLLDGSKNEKITKVIISN